MKKLMMATTLTLAVSASSPLMADVLSEGDNLVGATVGFGFTTLSNAATFGATYERGLIDDIFPDFNFGAGAVGAYTNYSSGLNYSLSHTFIGAQANVHYDAGEGNVQPYGGLMLGYNNFSYSDDDISGAWGGGISTGGQVGARYFFSDDLAANLRWSSSFGGWGTYSQLHAGVDYRF
ncbi:MAG: hypothetical protein LAT62_15955 [Natronospirillum sp.]|uniref:hypothetical protein n=1 Tax=Natronospirillum sp. TaxID=2812955 RepID=UPI0025E26E4F|nr:hypothetical protein [Natronospirillum sp.]MCH8553431.1 hypothetical protein [Natronospirillum sp.]